MVVCLKVTGVYRLIDAGYDNGLVPTPSSVPLVVAAPRVGRGGPRSSPSGMHPCAIFP